ncbi:MAG: hypothetical protein CMJ83_16720 [Planctomycetes bacterium]|nr:hypothetical protein [Planctomycetota bacterium]
MSRIITTALVLTVSFFSFSDVASAQSSAAWRRYQGLLSRAVAANNANIANQGALAGEAAAWNAGMASTNPLVRRNARGRYVRFLNRLTQTTNNSIGAHKAAFSALVNWWRMHGSTRYRATYASARNNLLAAINSLNGDSVAIAGYRRAAFSRY